MVHSKKSHSALSIKAPIAPAPAAYSMLGSCMAALLATAEIVDWLQSATLNPNEGLPAK
jgi:hypothetical protein